MRYAVETFALTKRFPPAKSGQGRSGPHGPLHAALDNVNLTIREGELFGLLGPNGAGKTTLIKMLSTLIVPTSGRAVVNGFDLTDENGVKGSIGLSNGDERSFYWRLTGRRNLEFFAALYKIPQGRTRKRIEDVIRVTGLEEMADARFGTYSTGMKQRLCIARALIHEPRILFLDEPTMGLDPTAARELREFIRDRLTRRHGVAVLLTTHLLQEAEEICDRIAVIDRGVIKGCGTMAELRTELGFTDRYSMLIRGGSGELKETLESRLPKARTTGTYPGEVLVEFDPVDEEGLGRVIDTVRRCKGIILRLNREKPTLWSIFSSLTQGVGSSQDGRKRQEQAGHEGGAAGKNAVPMTEGSRPPQPGPGTISLLKDAGRAARAFIKRDFLLETSYRLAFFLRMLGIFFSVAMFYFISRLVGKAAAPYLVPYGADYFSFVLIGIAFYAYSNVGLTVFSNNLREAQTTGTLEAILGTPTGIFVAVLSLSIWSFIFTTFDVLVYLSLGIGMAGLGLEGNYPAAAITLALTIVAMSSLGIMAGGFILIFKRGNPVLLIFSNLSGLLSGVYYPLNVLPDWLQSIARLIPITHSLEAMRKSLLRGASLSEVMPEISALLIFILIFLPLSLVLFRYAYNRARMDGSLTHY